MIFTGKLRVVIFGIGDPVKADAIIIPARHHDFLQNRAYAGDVNRYESAGKYDAHAGVEA